MDDRTRGYFLYNGRCVYDPGSQTTMGILTPCPLLYEAEVFGKESIVLYWHGDRDNIQREFPLTITPKQFYETVAANIMLSSVLNVGTVAEFKRNNFITKSSKEVMYCDENLDKKTILVGGVVLELSFLFQISPLEVNERIIVPRSYFGD